MTYSATPALRPSWLILVLFAAVSLQAADARHADLWTHLSSARDLSDSRGMSARFDNSSDHRVLELNVSELNVAMGETARSAQRGIGWVSIPPPCQRMGCVVEQNHPGQCHEHRLHPGINHIVGCLVRRMGCGWRRDHVAAGTNGDADVRFAGNLSRWHAQNRPPPGQRDPPDDSENRCSLGESFATDCDGNNRQMGASPGPYQRSGHGTWTARCRPPCSLPASC